MPRCSNPVQCQMASREECTCDCEGAYHSKIRLMMEDPDTAEEAKRLLGELKAEQEVLKKKGRKDRRTKRAIARKEAEALASGE